MNLPTVSVVMSVYNHGAFVRSAIDSILAQEGVDLQFVIVNDGSSDDSAAILEAYATADSRIRIIHQNNCGLTRALIRGCAEATGEFIARQDADDISLPSRFRLQINYMNQHDLAFSSCFVSQVGPENERLGEIQITDDPESATARLLNNHIGVPCHGSVMMRRSAYETADGYRSPFYYAQDTDLWSRLVENGRYGCVPQCLYLLRSSPESISGSRRDVQAKFHQLGIEAAITRRNQRSEALILNQASELTESVARQYPAAMVRRNRAMSLYMIGATLIRNGDAAGRHYLRMSVEENPFFCRAWIRYLYSFAVTRQIQRDDGRHDSGQGALVNQASQMKTAQDPSTVDSNNRPPPEIDVSVVISVFRDASHLRYALDSVLNQHGVRLEVIAIDDGSTDGSGLILDEYASRDDRVRVIHQTNTGLTRALIRGCAAARGEFIARQDADDISMPDRFALQVQLLRSNKEIVLASSFTEVTGPGGEALLVHDRPIDSQVATELLLNGVCGPPGHGSVMFRRNIYEAVGGYRPEFYFAQDCDLWLRLAEHGKICYIPRVLYRYQISPGSLSGCRNEVKELYSQAVHECRKLRLAGNSEEPVLARCRDLVARKDETSSEATAATAYFIGRNLLRSDPFGACHYLFQCLSLRPLHYRALICLCVAPVVFLYVATRKCSSKSYRT